MSGTSSRAPRRRSIRSRILLYSFLASLVVIVLFVGAITGLKLGGFRSRIETSSSRTALRLASSLTLPLWSYDTETCAQILRSAFDDGDIEALFLREDSGGLIAAFGRSLGDKGLDVIEGGAEVGYADSSLARGEAEIRYRGRLIGSLRVYESGAESLRALGSSIAEQALVALLEGAIVALLAFLAADHLISRRVLKLGAEIGRFSGKDLSARSADEGQDEIGGLARGFNEMADIIQRHAEGLETEVAERTRELEEANRGLTEANRRLSATVAELREAQDEIVESRRVASLGQLVGGIAHQLNTPLAAIMSANRFLAEELEGRILRITKELAGLDEVDAAILEEMIEESLAGEDSADFPMLRAKKRELRALLAAAGIEDADAVAETVVDANLYGLGSRLLGFLRNKRIRGILSVVEAVNDIKHAGGVINAASERASSVIRALKVYLGQGQAGERESVQLAPCIEEVLALFGPSARSSIELRLHLDRSLRVRGRREQLDLVWVNLVDNAVQAMGGKGRLEIRAESRGDLVLVSVLDTGKGVPPELRGRIFEAFAATGNRAGGLGIGLSTAKRIVEDHGGSIAFESEIGRTVFTVSLPIEAPEKSRGETAEEAH